MIADSEFLNFNMSVIYNEKIGVAHFYFNKVVLEQNINVFSVLDYVNKFKFDIEEELLNQDFHLMMIYIYLLIIYI